MKDVKRNKPTTLEQADPWFDDIILCPDGEKARVCGHSAIPKSPTETEHWVHAERIPDKKLVSHRERDVVITKLSEQLPLKFRYGRVEPYAPQVKT